MQQLVASRVDDRISHNATLSALAYASQWQRGLLSLVPDLDSHGLVAASSCFAAGLLWQEALSLLGGSQELRVFNAITNCLARASRWSHCLAILEFMCSQRLQPDDATYSCVISACEGQWQMALALLKALPAKQESSSNAAIAACGAQHQWRWSLWLLQEHFDILGCKSALSACERAAKWRECLHLLQLSSGAKSYITCASACEQARLWQEALDLLSHLDVCEEVESLRCRAAPWELGIRLLEHEAVGAPQVMRALVVATQWIRALNLARQYSELWPELSKALEAQHLKGIRPGVEPCGLSPLEVRQELSHARAAWKGAETADVRHFESCSKRSRGFGKSV